MAREKSSDDYRDYVIRDGRFIGKFEEMYKKVYGNAKITISKAFEAQPVDAFVKVDSVNAAAGKIWLQTWYQPVPGLRLIRHGGG